MFIIDTIQSFIESLEERDFYKYLALSITVILGILFLVFFMYYRATNSIIDRITTINDLRENVQQILTASKKVKKQREEIDTILAQDENFKIGAYFDKTLTALRLSDKSQPPDYSHIDHTGAYRENILRAKLTDMTMKDLAELLNDIEKNQRVYTKELEITKSRKGNLDINLTIATLERKVAST
jgi:hypothetical protein